MMEGMNVEKLTPENLHECFEYHPWDEKEKEEASHE
jgi:hypothetical protein